jgi:hypothetical protein
VLLDYFRVDSGAVIAAKFCQRNLLSAGPGWSTLGVLLERLPGGSKDALQET